MSTPSTGQRHTWTPEDDARLEAAVTALAASTLKGTRIWHAVCGRLAPELCVSPDAASSRYDKLARLRKDAAEKQRAEEEAKREAEAKERNTIVANDRWHATIERWAEQWAECPCGDMLPDAPDSTTVICRHCGRTWTWSCEIGVSAWRLDFDSNAKAEAEEAWAHTMRIVEQYGDDGNMDNALQELRDEVSALNRGQAEILGTLTKLMELWT